MLQCAKTYDSDLDEIRCLRLDIRADDPFTLPTIMVLATGLSFIWANRKCCADVEGKYQSVPK